MAVRQKNIYISKPEQKHNANSLTTVSSFNITAKISSLKLILQMMGTHKWRKY